MHFGGPHGGRLRSLPACLEPLQPRRSSSQTVTGAALSSVDHFIIPIRQEKTEV